MEFIKEDFLVEMAYRYVNAIDRCFDLGGKFTEHSCYSRRNG